MYKLEKQRNKNLERKKKQIFLSRTVLSITSTTEPDINVVARNAFVILCVIYSLTIKYQPLTEGLTFKVAALLKLKEKLK